MSLPEGVGWTIAPAGRDDVAHLLPLLRGYCDFYRAAPDDAALIGLVEALIADPQREGIP
ncbi:MAG: hypothetical protein ACRDU8_01815 [Egibacteraceae bacterium]